MRRDELLRLHALHKAAAAALEAQLKNQALDEYTSHGAAVTWRLSDGQVITGIQQDAVRVVDREAFLDYLEEHTAAVQRVEVRSVPGAFEESFLEKAVAAVKDPSDWATPDHPEAPTKLERSPGEGFPVADAEGRIVPGLQFVAGGRVSSISIRLDDTAKEITRRAAARYAEGALSAEGYFGAI
jgi:hypothetical protein